MSLTETDVSDAFRDLAGRVAGSVVTPSDPEWDTVRRAWNLAFDQHPDVVVVPAGPADVAAALAFAGETGRTVVPQGTGHLAAPLGDLAGSVLVNTSALRGVEVDADARVVRAGAGSRRSTTLMNSSKEAPVATRILEIDSVEGQRSRPSGATRLERLKVVASSPALRASPEAVNP